MTATIINLATRGPLAAPVPSWRTVGFQLFCNDTPISPQTWTHIHLTIEAARYAAAELGGAVGIAGGTPTVAVTIMRVMERGDEQEFLPEAKVTYTVGSYITRLERYPFKNTLAEWKKKAEQGASMAPSAAPSMS